MAICCRYQDHRGIQLADTTYIVLHDCETFDMVHPQIARLWDVRDWQRNTSLTAMITGSSVDCRNNSDCTSLWFQEIRDHRGVDCCLILRRRPEVSLGMM